MAAAMLRAGPPNQPNRGNVSDPRGATIIQTDALTKRYGAVTAVDSLSLTVTRGGVFGLLGPNGSGKTTTMAMLLGLVKPSAGGFRLLDHEGARPAVLKRVGAMVETPAFYPFLSGRDNLRFFQGLHGKGSPGEIDALLRRVELLPRANARFSTYSQGMKQRLGIAYALLGDPELMFLDEPTNGLDPAGVAEVRHFIADLGSGGRTVVLSSHILHEVEMVCERVAILAKGRLIAQGRVHDLLRQRDGLRVATTDDSAAATALATLPWVGQVQADADGLVVTAPIERAAEISRALAEAGIYLRSMTPMTVSLEQYFLEVTGDKAAPAPEARR
jgi:ABC-2 type transport system ATP-binding protein